MVDILEQIVNTKRVEVLEAKKLLSIDQLVKQIEITQYEQQSLVEALTVKPGIIAEFKRASPSKGIINGANTVEEVVKGYDLKGAAGISVLTDKSYFKAKQDDFTIARTSTNKPILRKEFIIDEYQLYESKAMGANVILLIAAILTKEEIRAFTKRAQSLSLEVLLELHDESEIGKISGKENIIGVNNRNLKTFKVDINQSIYLKKQLENSIGSTPLISESGLSSIAEIEILLNEGFRGFLLGEYFMKQSDPILAFSSLNKSLNTLTNAE